MINDFKSGDFSTYDGKYKNKLKRFYDWFARNIDKHNKYVWAMTFEYGYDVEFCNTFYNCIYKKIDWENRDVILTFEPKIYNYMDTRLRHLEDMIKERGSIPIMEGRIQCLKDCMNKFDTMS